MWLATLAMFVGSTAHYTVYWVQMLNENVFDLYAVDTAWRSFYGNYSDPKSSPQHVAGLESALQVLAYRQCKPFMPLHGMGSKFTQITPCA